MGDPLLRRAIGAALLALAAAGGARAATTEETRPQAPPAPTVTAVELASDARLDRPEKLRSLIAIQVGEQLSRQAVRDTLRNLTATGVASDVEVFSRPAGEGVAVIVALWANAVAEQVEITGELGLSHADLAAVLPQHEAQVLIENRVLRGIYQLEGLYHRRGYLEAEVRVRVRYTDPARTRAVVTYEVTSGPQAQISAVELRGDLGPFTRPQLVRLLKGLPGSGYLEERTKEDSLRLRRWLIGQGYRLAEVSDPTTEVDPASHSVRIAFTVAVGPRVEVEIQGARRRELERKGLLPFLGEEGYDEALLFQAVERLRRYYQSKGHHDVQIEPEEKRAAGELDVSLSIHPGPVLTLEEVRFSGNQAVSDSTLASLMTTSGRRLLKLGSGRLVDEVVTADLDNIRSYYALQGFSGTKVGPVRTRRLPGDRLELTVPIVEGEQRSVVNLELAGVSVLDPGRLLDQLRRQGLLRAGGPFHEILLEDSVDLVRARYESLGYEAVLASPKLDWDPTGHLVDVTIEVFEGPRTVVDQVIVRGNRHTRDEVIERTIGLGPGEWVSRGKLLNVERDLYRLGIFSRVDLSLAPAGLDTSSRDVLVRVEEGKTRRVSYGVFYDSENRLGGLLGFANDNLFGRAFRLVGDARVSEPVKRFRLLLEQPTIGSLPVRLTYSVFRSDENLKNRDQDLFNVKRRGTEIEAVRELEPPPPAAARRGVPARLRLGLTYDYRIVESTDVAVPLNSAERNDQPIQISSLIPNLLIDHRDDPLNPTRGWSTTAIFQDSFPLLSATASFAKLFVQQTGYWNLDSFGVLAGSLRVGAIEPLGTLADGNGEGSVDPVLDLPARNVPIDERFFAGGPTTHRAYRSDRLGILGQTLSDASFTVPGAKPLSVGTPVGGDGLLLLNLDYRFPLYDGFEGDLFFDSGNVWADWRRVDPREVKSGAGLGLRYLSPIGPLRIEIGWKLDRERTIDESPYVVYFSLGNPF